MTEADLLKAAGTKMFGIGVGLSGQASKDRLAAVTGDEEMTIVGDVPTPPFGEADYVIKVVLPDVKAYDAFLHRVMFKIKDIGTLRSMVVLREVKYETALPV